MEAIRDKARHQVQVRFGTPPPPGSFDRIPGVSGLSLRGDLPRCTVQGSFDPFVKALRPFEVLDLNSHEADLEETFLALYGKEEKAS